MNFKCHVCQIYSILQRIKSPWMWRIFDTDRPRKMSSFNCASSLPHGFVDQTLFFMTQVLCRNSFAWRMCMLEMSLPLFILWMISIYLILWLKRKINENSCSASSFYFYYIFRKISKILAKIISRVKRTRLSKIHFILIYICQHLHLIWLM